MPSPTGCKPPQSDAVQYRHPDLLGPPQATQAAQPREQNHLHLQMLYRADHKLSHFMLCLLMLPMSFVPDEIFIYVKELISLD